MNGGPPLEVVRAILARARRAPSAENSQPFRFRWDGERLFVLHRPERARRSGGGRHHEALLGLGCLLVALEIAAGQEGLRLRAEAGVQDPGQPVWAVLRLLPGGCPDPRAALLLERRCTDRRLFRGGAAPAGLAEELSAWTEEGVGLYALGEPAPALWAFLRAAEGLVWSDEALWMDVMRWLRTSQREVERTRDGASWRTMGPDLPESRLLDLLRRPEARRLLRRSGAPSLAGRWFERQLRSSPVRLLITVRGPGVEALVRAGRTLMRAWLGLTGLHLGVQPHSQASFFVHEAARGLLPPGLPPAWPALFAEGRRLYAEALGLGPEELPVMLLRAGPSAHLPEGRRTLRLPLDELLG